ncbi:hypothetical protein [Streptomyces canus]|uniref:helix-turn-helix transcriptional regulator n=1 Tax=Streptomyces canus TaxID=58343 RepID=UPI0038686864
MRRDGDALLLITALSGVQVMHTADGTVALRPGTLVLLSTRTPARFVVPQAMAMRSLRVPAVALGLHDTAGRIPVRPVVRDDGNPLARLLLGFLAGIDCSIEQMTVTEIESTRGALLSLVAGIVRAGRTEVVDDDFPALLRRQLEAWIVAHLSSGAIRVADLAAAHSVAQRTVHRAFAFTGDTVGSVLRSRRLAAARDDVVNTRRSIASIAQRWDSAMRATSGGSSGAHTACRPVTSATCTAQQRSIPQSDGGPAIPVRGTPVPRQARQHYSASSCRSPGEATTDYGRTRTWIAKTSSSPVSSARLCADGSTPHRTRQGPRRSS